MGGKVYRYGMYRLTVMDYHFDEIPEDGADSLKFFDDLLVDVEISRVAANPPKTKTMSVRCSELYTVKAHGDGTYGIDWDCLGPSEWFYKKLREQDRILDIIPSLSIHGGSIDRKHWGGIPNYYLQSDIYDEDIRVGIHPRVFEIKDLKMLEWLAMRGFGYSRF